MAKQKSSENNYQKNNTILKRDNKKIIIQYARYLK